MSGPTSSCCAPSCASTADIGEVVASHGAHIVTEKPMAGSLADADRLVRATRAANVRLMTNWPSAWSGALRRMQQLIRAGEAGTLLQVHTRMGLGRPVRNGRRAPRCA